MTKLEDRHTSRCVLKVDENTASFYHIVLGGPTIGWLVVANEEWEPKIDPALNALGEAIVELISLNLINLEDPTVQDILERHSIHFRKPGEHW